MNFIENFYIFFQWENWFVVLFWLYPHPIGINAKLISKHEFDAVLCLSRLWDIFRRSDISSLVKVYWNLTLDSFQLQLFICSDCTSVLLLVMALFILFITSQFNFYRLWGNHLVPNLSRCFVTSNNPLCFIVSALLVPFSNLVLLIRVFPLASINVTKGLLGLRIFQYTIICFIDSLNFSLNLHFINFDSNSYYLFPCTVLGFRLFLLFFFRLWNIKLFDYLLESTMGLQCT